MSLAADAVASGNDSELKPLSVVGPYQIERSLAHGGMGSVYLARRLDGRSNETVALKIIRDSFASASQMARFRREAQLLGSLDHPGVPALLDVGESNGVPWMAMEFVEGVAINEHCDRAALGLEERMRLLVELAHILGYVHRQGIVHRDIKPSNVLVDAFGKVKLVDFGVAKAGGSLEGAQLTRDMLAPMTLETAAPEQFRIGGHITSRTDIYQFGVLAYKLISGITPYRAAPDDLLGWGHVITNERPLPLRTALRIARSGGTPGNGIARAPGPRLKALDAIVRRAMAKRPFDRHVSMEDLIHDLRAICVAPKPRKWWRMAAASCLPAALFHA